MTTPETITGFAVPEDGYFHIATPGEWPHKPTGLIQVLDDEAMQSIVDSFTEYSRQPNWPGVLIDFDHNSLDMDKPTAAAGWITELQKRPNGIWAQIRWSDIGKSSIEGGRYRFISPVWRSSDCAMLGEDKIRPLKLMNCAVTNDPNIKGLFPLSNTNTDLPMRFAPPALPILSPANPLPGLHEIPLANAVMDDERRKAMFARMGGGGGGGGRSGSGRSGSGGGSEDNPDPSASTKASGKKESALEMLDRVHPLSQPNSGPDTKAYAPDPQQSLSPVAKSYNDRIRDLKEARTALDTNRPPKPMPPRGFDLIDEREAMSQAMKQPDVTSNEVLAARDAARAHNTQVKSELADIKKNIRDQYTTDAQQARALERYMKGLDKDYAKELQRWEKDNIAIDKWIERVDREISSTDVKLEKEILRSETAEEKAQRTENATAEKARAQVIKDQIAADKEVERKRANEIKEQARIAKADQEVQAAPLREYGAEVRKRSAYYDAISRGDMAYAKRLYPTADHAQVKKDLTALTSENATASATKKREYYSQFKKLAPPTLSDDV